jgi:hypothetical protein
MISQLSWLYGTIAIIHFVKINAFLKMYLRLDITACGDRLIIIGKFHPESVRQ